MYHFYRSISQSSSIIQLFLSSKQLFGINFFSS